jgi:hypothetical protein
MAQVIEPLKNSWARRFWWRVKDLTETGYRWTLEHLKAVGRWLVEAVRNVGTWQLRRILLYGACVVLVLYLAVLGAVFVAVRYFANQIPKNPPVGQIVYLDQGWGASVTDTTRQRFYYTPQGTSFVNLRYKWFVNLERADSSNRFADPSHMRALGFIVDHVKTELNPDQLPVGFTKHYDPVLKEEFLDFTCAACHTGELHVITKAGDQVAIRIEGGQAMHAFTSARPGHFGPGLMAAMTATFLNPWKWTRFSRNVLGGGYPSGGWHLRWEFGKMLGDTLLTAFSDTYHGKYPIDEGFGRTDAIARISNKVFGDELDTANYVKGNAPVSYPPVWDAPRFDWVQYTGSVSQPLARNLGESLGTGARMNLVDAYGQPIPQDRRFSSEARIADLVSIEQAIEKLKPPQWPEAVLGPIDRNKADQGGELYKRHCAHCHAPCAETPYVTAVAMPLRPSGDPIWHVNLIPIEEVGTDPQAALNFYNYRVSLDKTGLTADDIRPLLRAELREQAFRKIAFANLKNPLGFLGSIFGDGIRQADKIAMDVARLRNDPSLKLAPEVEADIDQQLNAIDTHSTTIGEGLNYLGLLLRKIYFAEHESNGNAEEFAAGMPKPITAMLRRSGPPPPAPPAANNGSGKPGSGASAPLTDSEYEKLYNQFVRQSLEGYGALDLPQVKKVYKARPLGGVWATAPYLHNGSVPNLYEMLLPADRRTKRFFISRMNFDPVLVGLVKEKMADQGFWFDTSIPGNLNIGHEFRAGYGGYGPGAVPSPGVIGPELNDKEREALVEYLKIHADQPGQCQYDAAGNYK